MIPIIRVKDKNGNIIPIPAFQGPQGSMGPQGLPGEVANAPRVRVNSESNFWEVSYDNGVTWESLGVKATGEAGPKGKSAYDIALESGYEGSEEDLGQQLKFGSKIAMGSYVGVGGSNPLVLTFPFVPKVVYIYQETLDYGSAYLNTTYAKWFAGVGTEICDDKKRTYTLNADEKTLSIQSYDKVIVGYSAEWRVGSADYRMNYGKTQYYWIAIC